MNIKIATIPQPYKDVAELLDSDGGDAKYEHMVATATPAMYWMIEHISDKYDLSAPAGLVRACDYVLEFMVQEHPAARAKYIEALAAKLEVPEQSVWEAFSDMLNKLNTHYRQQPNPTPALRTLD